MKRLLMLVGVAAVAGAMYVAAAPGSSQSAAPPTARQFATLKRQVASLSKSLKALKKDEAQVKKVAGVALGFIGACFFDSSGQLENLPVSQFGTTSAGFLFGTDVPGGAAPRSALDIDASGSPLAFLQEITPACLTSTAALRHGSVRSGSSRLQIWAERTR